MVREGWNSHLLSLQAADKPWASSKLLSAVWARNTQLWGLETREVREKMVIASCQAVFKAKTSQTAL